MLALIEQRTSINDCKVWARHLENSGKEATLTHLIVWMTTEMKSRMRATAPLRSTGQPSKLPVSHVRSDFNSPKSHKCWLCQNSNHWIDQCRKFISLSPENRLKAVKENHACFSCLSVLEETTGPSIIQEGCSGPTKVMASSERFTITRSYNEQCNRPLKLLLL